MALDVDTLKLLRESEDHVEFKRAIHNFPFDGGDRHNDRQVRVLITKMESLGLIQREGEKRGVRYLQTERFERLF